MFRTKVAQKNETHAFFSQYIFYGTLAIFGIIKEKRANLQETFLYAIIPQLNASNLHKHVTKLTSLDSIVYTRYLAILVNDTLFHYK